MARSAPSREVISTTPPASGLANTARVTTRPRSEQRLHRLQATIVVVIAGHHDDRGAGGRQVEQGTEHDPLRLGGGRRRVEQVAHHEHDVHRLGRGDPGDLGQDRDVFLGAAAAADRAADMPVRRVEDLHPSDGSQPL